MAPQRPPRGGNQSQSSNGSRPRPKSNGPAARKPVGSHGPQQGQDRPSAPKRRPPSGLARAIKGRASDTEGQDRLQKILAHAGVGSRRACEELILQGRVSVGGRVIKELGTKVDPTQISVSVDGQKVIAEKHVYFAVYKPKGYVSTNDDPSGRPRVVDILPQISQRVYTVGRLDEMSVGLMLMTNDGELANKLAHPKFGVEKLYKVEVAGTPNREVLDQLTDGIWLAEGKVRAKRVRVVGSRGDSTILEMALAEGKNREVRRMLARLGHKVMRLTRVAVGPITIKGLVAGQFRPLTGKEVDLLRRVADGQPVPSPWSADRKPRMTTNRPEGPRPSADRRPPQQSNGPPRSPQRFDDRRPGPSSNGPPRSPQRFDDRRPGPSSNGPPRSPQRFDDRRPGPSSNGPPRSPQRFDDRRPGPPSNGPPRRSEGQGGYQGRPPQGRPPERQGPPPRPGMRPPQDGPGRDNDRPRLYGGGPAPYQDRQRRPPTASGEGSNGRPQSRPPGNGNGYNNARPNQGPKRSGPPPLDVPRARKVIGMEGEPKPKPVPEVKSHVIVPRSENRPKPRMRPMAAKRPPGRPGPRPIPRRNRTED